MTRDLLQHILQRVQAGEAVALCALVRTRGSTPQKAGAAMVVAANGHTAGTIGGGCVEAEVRTRALRLLAERRDLLLSFQLNHDLGWDDGLICGGNVDVAIQVVGSAEQLRVEGDSVAIEAPDESGQRQRFDVPITAATQLVIAGAGHVGQALASVAALMDFDVTVIDDRADFATAGRFPVARRVVGEIETELRKLELGEEAFVVVVTRGHRNDGRALAAALQTPARYLGLIGSKRKIVTLFRDLLEQGVSMDDLRRVHAPIGLNIGAITPGEIAVSIAAELVAVRRGAGVPCAAMRMTGEQLEQIRRG